MFLFIRWLTSRVTISALCPQLLVVVNSLKHMRFEYADTDPPPPHRRRARSGQKRVTSSLIAAVITDSRVRVGSGSGPGRVRTSPHIEWQYVPIGQPSTRFRVRPG